MIVIVDYGMGNLGSIANMLKKVKAEAIVSSDPSTIEKADKLILPGVGAFDNGMQKLGDLGLIPVLNNRVLQDRIPILGLCLGMQLLFERSEEGVLPGLGWITGDVVRFCIQKNEALLKIPHMGWNDIQVTQHHALFEGLETEETRFYFVHSYYVVPAVKDDILATSYYGVEFVTVVGHENIVGTQFHPEKSHNFGMRLLQNFSEQSNAHQA
jgi:imidazole glycerol-phosphate synthase subunit HisH